MLPQTSPTSLLPIQQGLQQETNEPRAFLDSLDFLSGGLGGVAIGLLALGIFLQQYNYRQNAIQSSLSNFIYFKNNLSGSNLRNNPNRRSGGGSLNGGSGGSYYGGSGGSYNGGSGGSYNGGSYNGYKRRKVEPEDTGYGIVSAASEAYKVIKMIPDVIKTVQSDFGWDDEYDYDGLW